MCYCVCVGTCLCTYTHVCGKCCCVYLHVCVSTYICCCAYEYICMCVCEQCDRDEHQKGVAKLLKFIHMWLCVKNEIWICVCTYTNVWMSADMCYCAYICIYIYICMYVCPRVCICRRECLYVSACACVGEIVHAYVWVCVSNPDSYLSYIWMRVQMRVVLWEQICWSHVFMYMRSPSALVSIQFVCVCGRECIWMIVSVSVSVSVIVWAGVPSF